MVEIRFGNHTCIKCKKEFDYAISYQYKYLCIDCYTKELIYIRKANTMDKSLVEEAIDEILHCSMFDSKKVCNEKECINCNLNKDLKQKLGIK